MRGTVKWFDEQRGFGFITPEGGDGARVDDLFVHFRQVVWPHGEGRVRLLEGQAVEFEVGQDHRGRKCAIAVRRV